VAAEALPHKGATDVAESLRSLLDGSNQVNNKKSGIGSFSAVYNVPVVHGAVVHDLVHASGPVKAVLSSASLPAAKNGLPQQIDSPALSNSILALASSLLRCAAISLARARAIHERLQCGPMVIGGPERAKPSVVGGDDETQSPGTTNGSCAPVITHGLAGVINAFAIVFEAAQEEVTTAVSKASVAQATPPSLAAANASYSALLALQQALEAEALAAIVCLRMQLGSAAAAAEQTGGMHATDHANGTAAGVNQKGKKKKGGPTGVCLGRGTSLLLSSLEASLAAGVTSHSGPTNDLSGSLRALSLDADAADTAAQLRFAAACLHTQLNPCVPALAQHLAVVQAVFEANAARRKPKVAKGARDFAPDQMAIREVAFSKIVGVFKRHGAVSIDTPVFELRETLMGKYGEDSKLIYDLADQGGELLSLRYDLTVPFARYVAVNGVSNIKRYHIAKVYRRDQPQMTRGRFREFFQCDFDIAGAYSVMVPDAEVLKVLVEILDDLDLGEYEVKLNHRKLLDAMLDIAGVPAQKFRPICSAIDKLDKEPWEVVREEMVEEKGLPGDVADRIGEFVVLRDQPKTLLARLTEASHPLAQHASSAAALSELGILFEFLEGMGALDQIIFDLSLARGLDYYTGVIYEAVLKGGGVGSIAAGGRYDTLVGMFSGKDVPAVGVSIGIERVFAIMETQMRAAASASGGTIRETETDVLVASIGNGLQGKRMAVASLLWANGVRAEFGFKPNPKMGDQLGYALKSGIPLMVLFGEDEINRGIVKLKDLDAGTEEEVKEEDLASVVATIAAAKGERRIVYNSNTTQQTRGGTD